MGILGGPLAWLRGLGLAPGFTVCELGDQWITQGYPEHRLAREFYEQDLRCGRYESIDGNARGTVTADLNRPLHKQGIELGQFDLVTDFGTGEHVFDQAQVFRTIHNLVKMDGYFVFDRPTQGYPVHCYWNANECVWRDFAAANQYEIVTLERGTMSRGELFRGMMIKRANGKFITPQQGRYEKLLRPITSKTQKLASRA